MTTVKEAMAFLYKKKENRPALKVIKEELKMFDFFKHVLTVKRKEPTFEINLKDDNETVSVISRTFIEYNLSKIEYDTQKKLTEWIIKNIDKETVKRRLEEQANES